jgi:hypothetical protein
MNHHSIQDALEADNSYISFNLARAFLLNGLHEDMKMFLKKGFVMYHEKPQAFQGEASYLEALMFDVQMNCLLVCLIEWHALDAYPNGFEQEPQYVHLMLQMHIFSQLQGAMHLLVLLKFLT